MNTNNFLNHEHLTTLLPQSFMRDIPEVDTVAGDHIQGSNNQ